MTKNENRRVFLGGAGASVFLVACKDSSSTENAPITITSSSLPSTAPSASAGKDKDDDKDDDDVSAVEDLMREHGAIRRVLVVYREAAIRLRAHGSVPPDALQNAAKLMRSFAEDYHEKQLEEANIFPALAKTGDAAIAALIQTLLAQHQRGRDITDYILQVTKGPIATASTDPLARSLETFTRMYEEHTAYEDTVIFPAWKKALGKKQVEEMGDRFEDIEHKTFGKDGFEDAVSKVAAIEAQMGITLASLTAPPPAPSKL